jgi:VanZ family protein
MAALLFVGAQTATEAPFLAEPLDKVAHFAYYAVIAGLLAHAVGRSLLWVPLILVPMVGAADEWHQTMIAGRDASFWDWLADGAGTVAAILFYRRATASHRTGLQEPQGRG